MTTPRLHGLVTVLVVLALAPGVAPSQQPNSANGTMTVNFQNHPAGGAGPINVSVANGGSVVVTISGLPLQRLILAAGTVTNPGASIPPYGLLDIVFPFSILLNGFAPANVLGAFAFTNSTGRFEIAGAATVTSPANFGLQGGVADPAAPGGLVLTAATNVSVGAFTSSAVTFNESQLGDDVTVVYYHQALAFPFYGNLYGRSYVDTNGYIAFGTPFTSQWLANIADFRNAEPRVAPYWSDLHMQSVTPSTFGILSQAPASIACTETLIAGIATLQIDWLYATEAAIAGAGNPPVAGNRYDFRCTMDALGVITFRYGSALGTGLSVPASGNTLAVCGITSGRGLSVNAASQNLVNAGAVVGATATSPNDAIFELFNPQPTAFVIDLVAPPTGINFQATGGPTIYSVF